MKLDFTGDHLPEAGAVAVFMAQGQALSGKAAEMDKATGGALTRAANRAGFTGERAQVLDVLAPDEKLDRVFLVGLGGSADSKGRELDSLHAGAALVARAEYAGSAHVTLMADIDSLDPAMVAEGAALRFYRFDKYRTREGADKKPSLKHLSLAVADPKAAEAAYAPRAAVVDAVHYTRDLISEPANHLNPESFADRVAEMTSLGLEIDVLGEAEMKELGMGSLLSVGDGSVRESKLVVMRWNGGKAGDKPAAFVGKGVTFDTGGISLKPADNMGMMKWDMGGAGIVAGLMRALAGRKAPVNAVGVLGLVENMPDGRATRPGDVVTSMSGQTIEVLNTDAEGRLVLADAMWYTQQRFAPDVMIDLATLTGAIIVTLGHEYAGIFTDRDDLAEQLSSAGSASGDRVWRLPLDDAYDRMINTPTADMKNVGGKEAGSITAAQFLKRFTNDVPWCHIDVAGMVWSDKGSILAEKGGTGFGVRLLDRFVRDRYEGGE
ncbi:leucyl aminopeptidase [Yunchengibacter salinarum]|uniref:leucyl aminopeptidase n=1 Tax=Yunchengibacter salinarum TaxID=3133399 RepID=UPI0035B607C2